MKRIVGTVALIAVGTMIAAVGFSQRHIQPSVTEAPTYAAPEIPQTTKARTISPKLATQTPNSTTHSLSGGCAAAKQLFTTSPVAIEKISTVVPLGNFEPPSHIAPTTQVYFRYVHDQSGPVLTTLYTPADMTVTSITLFDNNSVAVPFDSYRIDFALCSGVSGYFIHVITLNDKLKAAFHEPYDYVQTSDVGLAKADHNYRKHVSVPLAAGEILGTAGGKSIYPDALDFGMSDYRTSAGTVANPSRWDDQDLHYVCPLDYFPPSIASSLYAKLGDFNGNRLSIDEPRCGEVYQDVPGTAQGLWIAKDSANPSIYDTPDLLTLGHSNFDHAKGVFVMGNVLRQLGFDNHAVYDFTPQSSGRTNVDFKDVKTDGGIYCYQTKNESDPFGAGISVLVQFLDTATLRIGKLSGPCGTGPWQFDSYFDFVR